jgi:D-alanyl-D-alanine carboxypeptidase/D-alanyl-D-alanine carboxypeptidase (penicillin-binding protein 5/6)
MNRIFCFVLVFIISLTCMPVVASGADITVSAESAVVMIAHTGQIVYEKNAYEKRGMASTTKIMSSVVALEYGNLYSRINASLDDINVEGTALGLKEGDSIDLLSLVSGMLISSGNDSANVTATLVGGGKSGFVKLMNLKARELGMDSTQFMNPSGLTEEGHYSTAYDMARLGSYAIKNPIFRTICSSKKRVVSFGDPVSDNPAPRNPASCDSAFGNFASNNLAFGGSVSGSPGFSNPASCDTTFGNLVSSNPAVENGPMKCQQWQGNHGLVLQTKGTVNQ